MLVFVISSASGPQAPRVIREPGLPPSVRMPKGTLTRLREPLSRV